ncbi:MAG: LPS export ABC transporter permease LptG [Pseudomonadota bacterium]
MIGAIADRHIGRTAIAGMGLALAVLVSLDAVFTLIAELGDVGRGTYTAGNAVQFTLLVIPQHAANLFPTAAVVGALLGVGGMAASGEIVAYRTVGLSRLRIAFAVVLAAAVLLLPILLLSEVVGPAGDRLAKAMRLRATTEGVALSSDAGLWVRDGDRVIHARRPLVANADPTEPVVLADIDVFEFEEGRLRQATSASSARFENGRWTLSELRRSRLAEGRVSTEQPVEETWESLIRPSQIRAAITRPKNLPIHELRPYVSYLEQNALNARPYEAALWARLAYPLSTLVIVFAATPFLFQGVRAGTLGGRLFVGMLLGIGFYLVNRWSGSLAQVYDISPVLAALLPSGLFALVTLWALRRGN